MFHPRSYPRRRSIVSALAAIVLATAAAPTSAAAQIVVLDEGIFTVVVAGTRVGREDFSIRRNLTDGGFIAQGNVLRGESRSSVVLATDSLGLPLRFEIDRNGTGRARESTSGEYRRGLWSGRTVSPQGESAREFRLPPVVLAADDEVVHHSWFLVRFIGREAVPVLRPRGLSVRSMVVESQGADTVYFGLDRYDAVRFVVREGVGGPVLREVWADAQGRLLRVRIPASDLVATRDEPPLETPPPVGSYEGSEPLPTGFDTDAFAVACDPAPHVGDAAGGPVGPADALARRGTGDRQEEQPHLPAVGDGALPCRGGPARRVREPAPERERERRR